MLDPRHIADAYLHVARVNHYLVMVRPGLDIEELQAAQQLLIALDNVAENADPGINLALNLIEQDLKP